MARLGRAIYIYINIYTIHVNRKELAIHMYLLFLAFGLTRSPRKGERVPRDLQVCHELSRSLSVNFIESGCVPNLRAPFPVHHVAR